MSRQRGVEERSLVAFGAKEERGLFALARAMGGYSGRLAADVGLEAFMRSMSQGACGLEEAVLRAHEAIVRTVAEEPNLRTGTSASLVALRSTPRVVHVVHTGACQAFAISPPSSRSTVGRLHRLTESHVLARTEPGTTFGTTILTSCLGFASDVPRVTCTRLSHSEGMVYLLVSDEVRDKDLIALVRELRERDIDSVEVLARRLYDLRWDDRESKNTTSVEHLERVLGVMAFRFD